MCTQFLLFWLLVINSRLQKLQHFKKNKSNATVMRVTFPRTKYFLMLQFDFNFKSHKTL
uniref:Uncharacterized protein n=1 Tax=Anguilla anguilla TaxID=7936 RepID=A0A0E9TVR9_ANGAN